MKFIYRIITFFLICILPITVLASGTDNLNATSVIIDDTVASGTLNALNSSIVIKANGHSNLNFVINSGLVGTITPEVSVDGINYLPISVVPLNSVTKTQSITTSGIWSANVSGFNSFELLVTSYTSGSTTANIRLGSTDNLVSCINNCYGNSNASVPNVKISINLGFSTGTVSTSIQYNVVPMVAYTNGQITGLRAASSTADNGTTVFTAYKNGTSIGTLSFANGATTAVATFGSPVSVSAGDVLTLQCTTAGTATNVGIVAEGLQNAF